jgi:hypothetical protein
MYNIMFHVLVKIFRFWTCAVAYDFCSSCGKIVCLNESEMSDITHNARSGGARDGKTMEFLAVPENKAIFDSSRKQWNF